MIESILSDKPSFKATYQMLCNLEKEIPEKLKVNDLLEVYDGYCALTHISYDSQRNGFDAFSKVSQNLELFRKHGDKRTTPMYKNERLTTLGLIFETDYTANQNYYTKRAMNYRQLLLRIEDILEDIYYLTPQKQELLDKADKLFQCCNSTIRIFNRITRENYKCNNGAAIIDPTLV